MIFKFCVGVGWFSLPSALQYSGVLVRIQSYVLYDKFSNSLTIHVLVKIVRSFESIKLDELDEIF